VGEAEGRVAAIGSELTLALCTRDAEAYAAVLRARGFAGTLHVTTSAEELLPFLPGADVLVCAPLDPSLLAGARRLRWIQSTWAGVEAWVRQPPPRGVVLTRMHGVFGARIAEWAFAHLLYAWWGVERGRQQQARGEWLPYRPGRLFGRTLGVAGTGDIGQVVAARGQALGMRVIGLSRGGEAHAGFDAVVTRLEDFLKHLDAVVITLPLTGATRGLFDARALALLPRGAWLLNAGRGGIVDEAALAEALRSGRLGGAVLDVFAEEPLPPSSPLWTLPGSFVTPHIAGPSVPEECAEVVFANLERLVRGEPLRGVVDFARGY
jgi:phosphoglycerate dehydrogenase-like enzyme